MATKKAVEANARKAALARDAAKKRKTKKQPK